MRRRGCNKDAIEAALLEENQYRCDPPLPDEEVRQIATSIAAYDPAEKTNNFWNSNWPY
jgi:putative DNA primase/helicase